MCAYESARLRRVLLVDDDPSLRAAVTDGLEILGGYEVVTASDGAEGLQRYFETQPDCVVVDVRMAGVNGYQFVRALRGDQDTAQTPVIVLSALVQQHEQLAGLLTGADAYLTKPVRIADLVRTIDQTVCLTPEERQRRAHSLPGMAPEEGEV